MVGLDTNAIARIVPHCMKNIDSLKQHGDLIWSIANLLRGRYRPLQYRRVMISLTVLRRLDCVLESSKDDVLGAQKVRQRLNTGMPGRTNSQSISLCYS